MQILLFRLVMEGLDQYAVSERVDYQESICDVSALLCYPSSFLVKAALGPVFY
jgi:hypothetical protein